jgi:hypothetical protein
MLADTVAMGAAAMEVTLEPPSLPCVLYIAFKRCRVDVVSTLIDRGTAFRASGDASEVDGAGQYSEKPVLWACCEKLAYS